MPLNSDLEIQKRRNRIMRLANMIEHNPGEEKSKIMGVFMLNIGVKKSTFYEYLGILIDSGRVYEDEKFGHTTTLWSADAWKNEELRRQKSESELVAAQAKVNSLDAYSLEQT